MVLDPETNMFSVQCSLPAGTYHYTFLVDGSWRTLPGKDDEADASTGIRSNTVRRAARKPGRGPAGAAPAPAAAADRRPRPRPPPPQATVKPLSAFNLYYSTGWHDCRIFFRVLLENGQPEVEEWQEVLLHDCPRRTTAHGSRCAAPPPLQGCRRHAVAGVAWGSGGRAWPPCQAPVLTRTALRCRPRPPPLAGGSPCCCPPAATPTGCSSM
jgi:hypothetical protein